MIKLSKAGNWKYCLSVIIFHKQQNQEVLDLLQGDHFILHVLDHIDLDLISKRNKKYSKLF